MEKKIGTIRLTLTYAGCMLGAGFVSGQELWQYFGAFGKKGIPSLILSLAILGIMTVLVVLLSLRTGETTMDSLIVRKNIPWLRGAVGAATALLLFGITGIMIAGIGALGREILNIPIWLGNAVIAVLLCVCAYFGFGGMLAIFSAAVPVLIGVTILITGFSIAKADISQIRFAGTSTNPMLGGWVFSALNYTALNYYGTMAVLPPLAEQYKSRKTLPLAVFLGSLALLFVALGMLLALAAEPECIAAELPMFELARRLGSVPGSAYAILLFLGMFGVAVSNTVAVMNYLEVKSEKIRRNRTPVMLLLVAAAYVGSLLGFSDLISFIYPVYGYLGLVLILVVLWNCVSEKRKSRSQ